MPTQTSGGRSLPGRRLPVRASWDPVAGGSAAAGRNGATGTEPGAACLRWPSAHQPPWAIAKGLPAQGPAGRLLGKRQAETQAHSVSSGNCTGCPWLPGCTETATRLLGPRGLQGAPGGSGTDRGAGAERTGARPRDRPWTRLCAQPTGLGLQPCPLQSTSTQAPSDGDSVGGGTARTPTPSPLWDRSRCPGDTGTAPGPGTSPAGAREGPEKAGRSAVSPYRRAEVPGRGRHSFKTDAHPRALRGPFACRPSYHRTGTPSSTSHGPRPGFAAAATSCVLVTDAPSCRNTHVNHILWLEHPAGNRGLPWGQQTQARPAAQSALRSAQMWGPPPRFCFLCVPITRMGAHRAALPGSPCRECAPFSTGK